MPASDNPWGTSNINLTCTMTAPKHWLRWNIDHTETPTMLARRASLLIFIFFLMTKNVYSTSWSFGPAWSVFWCGRCFGAVSVLAGSMYRWNWYLRALRDCHSPVHLMFQCTHCYLYFGTFILFPYPKQQRYLCINCMHAHRFTSKVKFDEIALVSSLAPKFWVIKC